MNERILIVDEDKNIRDLLASALKASGYGVLEAQSFAQARMLALSHCPDLMLLELNLPDGDGLDLIRFLRAQMDLPMVVVSVRAHQRDKVEALDGGADDYITKPFEIEELLARIRAALRKRGGAAQGAEGLTCGALALDPARHTVAYNGAPIELTHREFTLLQMLMENQSIVLTRDQILEHVWGYDFMGETNVVDVYIRYLRAKIDDAFGVKLIHTVRGVGYVLRKPQ